MQSGCISSLTDECVNGTSIMLPYFGNNLNYLLRTADTCFIKIGADRLLECLIYMQLVLNISKVHLLFLVRRHFTPVNGRNHCLELKKKILSRRLTYVWLHCAFHSPQSHGKSGEPSCFGLGSRLEVLLHNSNLNIVMQS